jgi:AhpD family alkylhydroperoxidase
MDSPAKTLPGAMAALAKLSAAARSGVPTLTLELINLRVSQINGCSVCVEIHGYALRRAGETDERLFAVAAWRDSPYFTDAERAALALAEATTRICDRPDPVPDAVWDDAARHYEDAALAALVMAIATINVWNRLNVATKQLGGAWTATAGA